MCRVRSCGASAVGTGSGSTAPSHSPPSPWHTPAFFPTSSGISFSAAALTFSEAEALSPTSVPHLPLALKIFPSCSGLETVAARALTELPFVLSH